MGTARSMMRGAGRAVARAWLSAAGLVLLVLIGILPRPAEADPSPLEPLAKEAARYAQSLEPPKGQEAAPGQARLLRQAARLLVAQRRCDTALRVQRDAWRVAGRADFAAWRDLAATALCAGDRAQASRAAYNAYLAAADGAQRASALRLAGGAMEARSSWRVDWKALALAAYRAAHGETRDPEERRWLGARIQVLEAGQARARQLGIERAYARTDGPAPALCIDFDQPMPSPEEGEYATYIRARPAFDAVFERSGASVCARGARYGTRYRVTVRRGLRSEKGVLVAGAELEVVVGDRDPELWLDGSSYVLPLNGPPAVPIYHINTPRVHVELLRVHERNLLSPYVQRHFPRALDGADVERIASEVGERVWQGEVDLRGEPNRASVSRLPLEERIFSTPGLYVLTAVRAGAKPGRWEDLPTQWLVVSDAGLTAYEGRDGLSVVARGLASARPLSGLEVALYARNNRELARATTDVQGRVHFAPGLLRGRGGREAVQLTAWGPGLGYTFLSLRQAAFDLSDRGVAGRSTPGPLDAYLYTERGIYRPGEAANLVGLLRDPRGQALEGLPLTLRLTDPGGRQVLERVLQPRASGAYLAHLPISASARTGRWRVAAYADPEGEPVGRTDFLVEAIVPPRLEVHLSAGTPSLRPGVPATAELRADYLFGAPAGGLRVRSGLTVERDPDPFPEHPGYRWGPAGEPPTARRSDLPEQTTGPDGRARVPLALGTPPATRHPLRARLRAEVLDLDGRASSAQLVLPVRHLSRYIGVRPRFEGGRVARGERAGFDVIALDAGGAPVAVPELRWRLVAEEHSYQWFRKGGSWRYEAVVREHTVREGRLSVAASGPAELALAVGEGRYRLEASAGDGGVLAALRFGAGALAAPGDAEHPDRLQVTLDKARYLPGERARLRIRAPFAGSATLVIATDRVLEMRDLDLPDGSAELEVPVSEAWGAGAYALVSAYRPGGASGPGPGRAIGLAWIQTDPITRRLEVTLDPAEVVRPRTRYALPVSVQGAGLGETVWMTVAAVDEGVVHLTGFRSPDPLEHYLGRRRLGVDLRDAYGRLIHAEEGGPAAVRSGAGASGRRAMPPSHVEVVSLFSGIVRADAAGRASIPLDLPDYNGRLRLMAVAWTRTRLGAAGGVLTVRDPVSVLASLPRFLAAGDTSRVHLTLHNTDGPAGPYQVSVRAEGVLSGGEPGHVVELASGARATVAVALRAEAPGEGRVELAVSGPGAYRYARTLGLGVRGVQLPVVRRRYVRIAPGQAWRFPEEARSGLYAEGLEASASLSSRTNLDLPAVLRQLQLYPYGCLEQVTSRALPLLYYDELARRWSLPPSAAGHGLVGKALDGVLDKQRYDGGFGLWSGDDPAEPWLSAYAMDFLVRARQAGHGVPEAAYRHGLEWLGQRVREDLREPLEVELAARAYAHWVLAAAGQGRPEEARYLLDTLGDRLPTSLAYAQLGAAFAQWGDAKRSRESLARALRGGPRALKWGDYGSPLRDLAGVVSLVAELGEAAPDPAEALRGLAERLSEREWLSTQELAWLALAARGLKAPEPLRVAVAGESSPRTQDPTRLEVPARGPAPEVVNRGASPVWATITVRGTPERPLPPGGNGLAIERRYYRLDGSPADLDQVRQGDLLVAVIRGRVETGLRHRALIVDPLPAGLEVENPRLRGARGLGDLSWLPKGSPTRYIEALDDRYVAALDLGPKARELTLRYLARAVTPGRYGVPAAEVEDMYRPRYRARSGLATLRILPRQ